MPLGNAAILSLLFMVPSSLDPALALLYFCYYYYYYIITTVGSCSHYSFGEALRKHACLCEPSGGDSREESPPVPVLSRILNSTWILNTTGSVPLMTHVARHNFRNSNAGPLF